MEVYAGTVGQIIENNDRSIVKHGDLEIGVMHRNGEFFAYRNLCLHQGGPACEGMVIGKVEDILGPDQHPARAALLGYRDALCLPVARLRVRLAHR